MPSALAAIRRLMDTVFPVTKRRIGIPIRFSTVTVNGVLSWIVRLVALCQFVFTVTSPEVNAPLEMRRIVSSSALP